MYINRLNRIFPFSPGALSNRPFPNARKKKDQSTTKTKTCLTDSKEDVQLVKALSIVVCQFESKLPTRATATLRKWKEEPQTQKEISCPLCGDFIIGALQDYIQHIWEKRAIHDEGKKSSDERLEVIAGKGSERANNDDGQSRDENVPDGVHEPDTDDVDDGASMDVEVASLPGDCVFDEDSLSRRHFGIFKCRLCDDVFVNGDLRDAHEDSHADADAENDAHTRGVQRHSTGIDGTTQEIDDNNPEKPKIVSPERICPICDKTFASVYAKKRHFAHVHRGAKSKRRPCPECGKMYSSSGLRAHRDRDHRGVRKRCLECPAPADDEDDGTTTTTNLFKDAAALWAHRQRCHGAKKFRCAVCDKEFSLKSSWKKHYNSCHGS